MSKELLRSEVARGIAEGQKGVDREHGIIRGFAVMTKGNVKDYRGWEIDDETLENIAAAGNKIKLGQKSRFGHPNMSSTALGTFLGRAKNFRVDGDIVRADLFFDETAYETPDGDLANYVMHLAESDADAFGTSVVLGDYELKYRLDNDGARKKDDKGKELPPLLRVKKLFAVDVVDDPAANNGMFGGLHFFNPDVKLSAEATQFLDKFLSNPDAVTKVIGFLERYRANKEQIEETGNPKKEGLTMELDLSKLTLEQLKAGRPELVTEIERAAGDALASSLNEQQTSAVNAAVAAERARAAGIFKSASDLADDKLAAVKPLLDAGKKAVEDGLSADAAESSLKGVKLQLLSVAAPAAAGHAGGEDHDQQGKSHLMQAREYAAQHKCSITEALKATAPAKRKAVASK